MCKGNFAGHIEIRWRFHAVKSAFLLRILPLFSLTVGPKIARLARRTLLPQESIMSDEKLKALHQSHALHPHPNQVRDPLFTSGSPFFDPRDLVQVKYELLRRVRVDGDSVSHATSLFALSRPTFYAALAAWERVGLLRTRCPLPSLLSGYAMNGTCRFILVALNARSQGLRKKGAHDEDLRTGTSV